MSDFNNYTIIIPARFQSTRLAGKMLLDIAGKPMIQQVYEQALKSNAKSVIVATDHTDIEKVIKNIGGKVCLTSKDHQSGTDRIVEVINLLNIEDDEIILNLQGDEPLMPPSLMNKVAQDLDVTDKADMSTLATPIHTKDQIIDKNIVKVVFDTDGFALYFSRATIPFAREGIDAIDTPSKHYFRHLGLYAYNAKFLRKYTALKPCDHESLESLEQLRALFNGYRIHLVVSNEETGHGVDTIEDLNRVQQLLKKTDTPKDVT
jgi:3-deoxy-manno-octulosonate cytidylyltransferase (CMP-KDO synthetase)